VRAVPHLCGFYPVICLTTEEKVRKNLSQGSYGDLLDSWVICFYVSSIAVLYQECYWMVSTDKNI